MTNFYEIADILHTFKKRTDAWMALDYENNMQSPLQKEALLDIIQAYENLSKIVKHDYIHYKTRKKLQKLLDQCQNLVISWRLLANNDLAEEFDINELYHAIFSMTCDFSQEILLPVTEYYYRAVMRGSYVDWSLKKIHVELYKNDNNHMGLPSRIDEVKSAPNEIIKSEFDARQEYLGYSLDIKFNDDYIDKPIKLGATEVAIFYGTTRNLNNCFTPDPQNKYLNGRGDGKLKLGCVKVSIPPGHKIGKVEQPIKIWKFRLKEKKSKHIIIESTEQLCTEKWVEASRDELERTATNKAFIFIHGFNVTFGQAMRRAAQIARDIEYPGLITAFSWGSQGSVNGYAADEDAVQLSIPALQKFLKKLHRQVGVHEFHIVAHSMGNRALLEAMKDTKWWMNEKSPVNQVVFAAPDVDAEIYKQAMLQIRNHASRYTLYGSEKDWALAISRSIRKNHPRAGEGGKNILVLPGVDTVDVTIVGDEMFGLGHSYIADKRTVLVDLWSIFKEIKMTRFGLNEIDGPHGKYWEFRP